MLLLFALLSLPALAQDTQPVAENEFDADLLNLKIESVEASTTLDEQTAGTLVDLYRRTLTNLERVRAEQASADELAAAGSSAPDELIRVRAAVEKLRADRDKDVPAIAPRTKQAELEQSMAEEKAALNEAEVTLVNVRKQYTNEVARPGEVRERLTAARTERDVAMADSRASAPIGQAAEVTEARRWQRQSRAARLTAEMRKLEQELLTHEPRLELLAAQQELAELQVETTRTRARLLENAISARRGAEAEQALQDAVTARQELVSKHPEIARVAAANVALGDRLTQRTLEIESTADQRDAAQLQVTRLADELSSTGNKLAIAGLNQTLGQLLIAQRRELPDLRSLKKQTQARETQVATIGLEQIEFNEQRRDLRKADHDIRKLAAELSAEEIAEFGPELRTLVQNQSELLDHSIDAGARYLRVLGELDLAERQLTDAVTEYKEFLDRTLLWVRTTTPVDIQALLTLPAHVGRFFSISGWTRLFKDLAAGLNNAPIFVILLIGLLLSGLLRPRLISKIDACAQYVGQISKDRILDSFLALAYTAIAAAPLPLLLMVTGYTLGFADTPSDFSHALAAALIGVGADLFIIRFFFIGSREQGLFIKHCAWSEYATAKLRHELRWYVYVFPLAHLVSMASLELDTGDALGGFTIISSVIAAGAFAVLLFRLFTPAGGVLRDLLRRRQGSLLTKALPFWLVLLGSVLPVLLILWLAGYSYTAEVLAASYMYSFWLVLWLKVLYDLLVRWLRLGAQRLKFRAAIERRDAARAERAKRAGEAATEKPANTEEADFELEEQKVDFEELGSDSRFLLKTAVLFAGLFWLWLIWAPVIPALGVLDDIILWTKSSVVNGEVVQMPVTLVNIILAIFAGFATGVLTKGLPSLVELVLLHSTNLTTGGRYTANTLLRYTIIGIGSIIVISMLGVSWSKAQWLVAAMGVGIGFGLQEIVANFISGLIILFERPIRVGDIVTVGDTSGMVTRIQIRATTVRDYDRRELLVPNKEFITGRLLNWSLSDEIIRQVIYVGIAYGSDVELATKLAEQAAREHPNVLDDPEPFVIFESFGDNSLNLSLRVFLPSMEFHMATVSNLNVAINKKFADAGIVIAFPQRDVHLNTTEPLEVRLQPAETMLKNE